MKKLLFVVVALLITSSFVFANEKTERIVENFWNKGQFVKTIADYGTAYINKSTISNIFIDDGGISIGYSTQSRNYAANDWDIFSDSFGNIVLKHK